MPRIQIKFYIFFWEQNRLPHLTFCSQDNVFYSSRDAFARRSLCTVPANCPILLVNGTEFAWELAYRRLIQKEFYVFLLISKYHKSSRLYRCTIMNVYSSSITMGLKKRHTKYSPWFREFGMTPDAFTFSCTFLSSICCFLVLNNRLTVFFSFYKFCMFREIFYFYHLALVGDIFPRSSNFFPFVYLPLK